MPEIGETKYGRELGKASRNKFIWQACPICGKQRWVHLRKGKPEYMHCRSCAARFHTYGEKNNFWKGGRYKDKYGYIHIKLQPDGFFYPMHANDDYVFEHRLVMAKKYGRCLQDWEQVHHKGIRYSDIRNKSDNLGDNLEMTTVGSHIREHTKGYHDGYQKGLIDGRIKQIQELKELIEDQTNQIRLLQWHIKQAVRV